MSKGKVIFWLFLVKSLSFLCLFISCPNRYPNYNKNDNLEFLLGTRYFDWWHLFVELGWGVGVVLLGIGCFGDGDGADDGLMMEVGAGADTKSTPC